MYVSPNDAPSLSFTFIVLRNITSHSVQIGGFRKEAVDLSSTTQAKFFDTVVLIAGAIIMTLYKGLLLVSSPLKSDISQNLLVQPSNCGSWRYLSSN